MMLAERRRIWSATLTSSSDSISYRSPPTGGDFTAIDADILVPVLPQQLGEETMLVSPQKIHGLIETWQVNDPTGESQPDTNGVALLREEVGLRDHLMRTVLGHLAGSDLTRNFRSNSKSRFCASSWLIHASRIREVSDQTARDSHGLANFHQTRRIWRTDVESREQGAADLAHDKRNSHRRRRRRRGSDSRYHRASHPTGLVPATVRHTAPIRSAQARGRAGGPFLQGARRLQRDFGAHLRKNARWAWCVHPPGTTPREWRSPAGS